MAEWLTIEEAAREVAASTGKEVGLTFLLKEAFHGRLNVCAQLPSGEAKKTDGVELYCDDGRRMTCATDGIYRNLSSADIQSLHTHNRLALAGRRTEVESTESGVYVEAFAGPDAPTITIDDLRISSEEMKRFLGY